MIATVPGGANDLQVVSRLAEDASHFRDAAAELERFNSRIESAWPQLSGIEREQYRALGAYLDRLDGHLPEGYARRDRWLRKARTFSAPILDVFRSDFERDVSRFRRAMVEFHCLVHERVEQEYRDSEKAVAHVFDDDLRAAFLEGRQHVASLASGPGAGERESSS